METKTQQVPVASTYSNLSSSTSSNLSKARFLENTTKANSVSTSNATNTTNIIPIVGKTNSSETTKVTTTSHTTIPIQTAITTNCNSNTIKTTSTPSPLVSLANKTSSMDSSVGKSQSETTGATTSTNPTFATVSSSNKAMATTITTTVPQMSMFDMTSSISKPLIDPPKKTMTINGQIVDVNINSGGGGDAKPLNLTNNSNKTSNGNNMIGDDVKNLLNKLDQFCPMDERPKTAPRKSTPTTNGATNENSGNRPATATSAKINNSATRIPSSRTVLNRPTTAEVSVSSNVAPVANRITTSSRPRTASAKVGSLSSTTSANKSASNTEQSTAGEEKTRIKSARARPSSSLYRPTASSALKGVVNPLTSDSGFKMGDAGSGGGETKAANLKDQFAAFSKFGDTSSDGKQISLSQCDKWMKQAHVIDGKKITTTDTSISFKKLFKTAKKVGFEDFKKYVEDLATSKKMESKDLTDKLTNCGAPGLSSATKAVGKGVVERLTDTSKYTGSHRERFDASGKGKGIEGRVDLVDQSGYVASFKSKLEIKDGASPPPTK